MQVAYVPNSPGQSPLTAGSIRSLSLAPTVPARPGNAPAMTPVATTGAVDPGGQIHGQADLSTNVEPLSGNPGNPTVTIAGDNVVGGSASATVTGPGGMY